MTPAAPPAKDEREVIVVRPYPGGPEVRIPVPKGPPEIVCWICGWPWADAYAVEGRPACGPCFVTYPYNLHPDWCPPGLEQGGSGI